MLYIIQICLVKTNLSWVRHLDAMVLKVILSVNQFGINVKKVQKSVQSESIMTKNRQKN